MGDGRQVGEGFDRAAQEYDDLLRHNREGAARLVGALPAGRYEEILDVGCGTGFVSEEMISRFATARVTGVDPSAGMLEQFRDKLTRLSVEATLIQAGVHEMPVEDGAFDAVVSGMAFHWFPEKPAAVAAMARPLRPGGTLGILAAGTGTDEEFRQILEAIDPPVPSEWVGVFPLIHRGASQLADYMEQAGLEVVERMGGATRAAGRPRGLHGAHRRRREPPVGRPGSGRGGRTRRAGGPGGRGRKRPARLRVRLREALRHRSAPGLRPSSSAAIAASGGGWERTEVDRS